MFLMKAKLRLFVKRTPLLYVLISKLSSKDSEICRKDTDLCIEGYPSSANSFAYTLIRQLTRGLAIAHHSHSLANVVLARKYGTPTVIQIRDPVDAISSRLVRFPFWAWDTDDVVYEYCDFYAYVLDNITDMVVVDFDEIIGETGQVLDKIANRCGITFLDYSDLEAVKARVKDEMVERERKSGDIDNVSLPSEKRDRQKKRTKEAVKRSKYIEEARRIYEAISARRT